MISHHASSLLSEYLRKRTTSTPHPKQFKHSPINPEIEPLEKFHRGKHAAKKRKKKKQHRTNLNHIFFSEFFFQLPISRCNSTCQTIQCSGELLCCFCDSKQSPSFERIQRNTNKIKETCAVHVQPTTAIHFLFSRVKKHWKIRLVYQCDYFSCLSQYEYDAKRHVELSTRTNVSNFQREKWKGFIILKNILI